MTVSSIEPVNTYTGNSSNIKFDFDFLIENSSELIVQHKNSADVISILKEGVDYSINEIGNPAGSWITFPLKTSSYAVLSSDETISLMLSLVIKQELPLGTSTSFKFDTFEWMFDYITRILQILNRRLERCIKITEGSDINTDKLAQSLLSAEKNAESINTVSDNISAVNSAGASIENINAVSADLDVINALAEDLTDIENVKIWAEGTDAEVQAIGGTRSAKGWALVSENANTSLNNLNEAGEARFSNLQSGIENRAELTLDNLAADGRAKFQYAPFSINSGAIDNTGANATLTGSGGVPVSIDKYTIPALSSNNSSYGVCSANAELYQAQAYQFTSSHVICTSSYTWTMQLADDNHIPAGAQCSFSYQSSNTSYWHESIGTRTYGISGLKITFIYTDNTSETVFDNSNLTPYTGSQQALTGSGACASFSKEVKAVQVYVYHNGTTWAVGGNFRLRAEYTSSSSDTLICRPCTITTADNITKSFDADSTLDCSNKADGNYYVMKSITDGSLNLASSLTVSKTSPASPASGLWLDNSHAPLMLKNFRVTGSPVISADGIASGFSGSDYLTTANINKSLNTFKIEGEFVTSDSVTTSQMIFSTIVTDSNSTLRALALQQYRNSTLYCYIPKSSGGDWIVGTTVLQANTKYYFKINFDGVNVTWAYGTDKNNLAEQPSAACLTSTLNNVIRIGLDSAANSPFLGSIDLNAFKIYVDNKLVYEAVSNDVYLGDVTVSGGLITAISNNPFNWNGITGSSAAMPSNRYINLTLGASGSTYTAPADGWFNFYTIKSTAGYTLLQNNTNGFRSESRTTVNNTGCGCYLPARKGDVITLTYDGANSSTIWRFYYAQGN